MATKQTGIAPDVQSLNHPHEVDSLDEDVQEMEAGRKRATVPQLWDRHSVSGDEPHPEADDSTLEMAHHVGIAQDADQENPQPLNIARDVQKAERSRRE